MTTIIDADRPICDPHHHLWHHETKPYLLEHLLDDLGGGHNFVSTVFVECLSEYRQDGENALKPVGETEFVDTVAASVAQDSSISTAVCAGIVSFADLLLGEAVGPVLDEHTTASNRFCGIRHSAAFDPSPDIRKSHVDPPQHLFLRDDFRQGFAELGKRNLSFDAWLFHPQIPELTELARAFPATPIVLDHFGGPLGIGPYRNKSEEVFQSWLPAITELAKCPNVYAKLGGALMPINGFSRLPAPMVAEEIVDATGRYYRETLALFGPERCMFESNFPVDRVNTSYSELWNAFKIIAKDFSAADNDLVFHDVAASFYRLPPNPTREITGILAR